MALGYYCDINRAVQETLLRSFNFIVHQDKAIFQGLFVRFVIETNTYIHRTNIILLVSVLL